MDHLDQLPTPQGSGNIIAEQKEVWRAHMDERENYELLLASGNYVTAAHITSQQPWLRAWGLLKIKWITSSTWSRNRPTFGSGAVGSGCWLLRKGEIFFFRGIASCGLSSDWWSDIYVYFVALIGVRNLSMTTTRGEEVSREMEWGY